MTDKALKTEVWICFYKYHFLNKEIFFTKNLFSCSVVSDFLRPHRLRHARLLCPSPSLGAFTNSCPSSWWCHPTTLSSVPLLLPSIFSSIRVFSSESALHIRWPKYWSFSISPSYEYLGLISFRIYWYNLLAVLGTLKHLLKHDISKTSILGCSAFLMLQLSHSYMTTVKTIVY